MTEVQRRFGLFFLLFSFGTSITFAQEDFISGYLFDVQSQEPVVFATVRVQGKALGVITNQDGSFQLPFSFQEEGHVLVISSMGYESKNIPMSALSPLGVNRIFLQPAIFQLQEAMVRGSRKKLTARRIIKKALEAIPINYPQNPFSLVGYYRDYQLKESEYINLNEAIVQVYDQGFSEKDYTTAQYGILSYGKNLNFQEDSFAAKPYDYAAKDKIIPDASLISAYGGNELVILQIHDAIRNHRIPAYSFVGELTKDFLRFHKFSELRRTSYKDEQVYQITVKKNSYPFKVLGTIYIDVNDYAIRKLDYTVFKKDIEDKASDLYGYERKQRLLYQIIVEYHTIEETMFLNYISMYNTFDLTRPAPFRVAKIILDREHQLLQVQLTKPPANLDQLKVSHIQLGFAGKSIGLKEIVSKVGTTITLGLSTTARQIAFRDELFADPKAGSTNQLVLRIDKLKDTLGNKLNDRPMERLGQYREFFVQQVIPNQERTTNFLGAMDKTKTLGDSLQPRLKSKLKTDFWMNTPLKKITQ